MATVNELKDEALSLSEYLSDTAIESEAAFKAWYPAWYESQTGQAFSGKFNKAAWQVAISLMAQALEKEEAKVLSEPTEGDTQELTTRELAAVTELLDDEAGEDAVDPEYEAVKAQEEAFNAAYQEAWNEVHKTAYQLSGISFSEPKQLIRWYLETYHYGVELIELGVDKVVHQLSTELTDYDELVKFSTTLKNILNQPDELVETGQEQEVDLQRYDQAMEDYAKGTGEFADQPEKPRSNKLNRPYLTRNR